jgi:hypothetical protein
MKRPGKSGHAMTWLRGEPAFAQLRERSLRLAELQEELRGCVPGVALTAIALEKGVLTVGAAQASAAAKVRQFGPSILAELNRRGWRVESIRFKPRFAPPRPPERRAKEALGPGAVASVAALSDTVSDPRLKEALLRLARRHGGG